MAVIVESIEISRRPEDVFSYATDLSRFPEWQEGVVSARQEDDAPLTVGSRAVVVRRVGRPELLTTEEIAELNPPRTWAVRGVGGLPVIAIAKGTVEPLDNGERSRVTIALEFEGHGIGKLLVPLFVRRQARRALPRNAQKLKGMLERDGRDRVSL
jgi:carbon monoxide dehydrogenase subunit G